MIDEQSSASEHDCASDRSAIGAGWEGGMEGGRGRGEGGGGREGGGREG